MPSRVQQLVTDRMGGRGTSTRWFMLVPDVTRAETPFVSLVLVRTSPAPAGMGCSDADSQGSPVVGELAEDVQCEMWRLTCRDDRLVADAERWLEMLQPDDGTISMLDANLVDRLRLEVQLAKQKGDASDAEPRVTRLVGVTVA